MKTQGSQKTPETDGYSKGQAEKSRLLIVEDHPLFREGLCRMIDRNAALSVCGQVADGSFGPGGRSDLQLTMRLPLPEQPDHVI